MPARRPTRALDTALLLVGTLLVGLPGLALLDGAGVPADRLVLAAAILVPAGALAALVSTRTRSIARLLPAPASRR